MNRHFRRLSLILIIGASSTVGLLARAAQDTTMNKSPDCLWQDIDEAPLTASQKIQKQRKIVPDQYRTVRLDQKALKRLLARVPMEFTEAAKKSKAVMTLPMPDGSYAQFRLQQTQVMSPGLAQQMPAMKTYSGHGIEDPTATIRCDWSPTGFHAMVLSTGETVYIDPYRKGDTKTYISYYKKDLKRDPSKHVH